MRLPSLEALAQQARETLVRFPWTIAAAVVAAAAAITATAVHSGDENDWARASMVAALGLPLTVALTLLAEERQWSRARAAALNLAGIALLVLFYQIWPGPEQKHELIRHLQLSAGLHLLVAVVPFLGQAETESFWQYNRRLFLGFLRAVVFSAVLFVGLAIALGALDKLFGVDVPEKLYLRLWIVVAFVVNTWIFLAAVPQGLKQLVHDTTYPRVLKVFSQYILTPLVFLYLVMLLAYLVKIVVGGEWPSGWIGWLVTSVAVTGLLGFLLVHPLRDDPNEGWIRTYTRWLFIGLIPAAVVLLVAFWKRVLPYGLTELRLLGIILGWWLLVIALTYTFRQRSGIRPIPLSLAVVLLITVFGPLSVTAISVASQGRRLARLIAMPAGEKTRDREASGALRFLLEHGARRQVARAVPGRLPDVKWDSLPDSRLARDQAAGRILAGTGITYLDEYTRSEGSQVYFSARHPATVPVTGYDWMFKVSASDTAPIPVGRETVRVWFDSATSLARVRIGADSLLFDLGPLADSALGSSDKRNSVPADRLFLAVVTARRRGGLALDWLNGVRVRDSLRVRGWNGVLFLSGPQTENRAAAGN
jgi:Domain of unknown function (DUF4153)